MGEAVPAEQVTTNVQMENASHDAAENAARAPALVQPEVQPTVASSSKKDWNGYKIPVKRKEDFVKGDSKRRKKHSKCEAPVMETDDSPHGASSSDSDLWGSESDSSSD